jgi:patatin-like phospholipase/acyl hydrolase
MAEPADQEPVFILSLDGGGIRGVSELVMLKEIMMRIQKKGKLSQIPKPCEYFDLMGGTSTGGYVWCFDIFSQPTFCRALIEDKG